MWLFNHLNIEEYFAAWTCWECVNVFICLTQWLTSILRCSFNWDYFSITVFFIPDIYLRRLEFREMWWPRLNLDRKGIRYLRSWFGHGTLFLRLGKSMKLHHDMFHIENICCQWIFSFLLIYRNQIYDIRQNIKKWISNVETYTM